MQLKKETDDGRETGRKQEYKSRGEEKTLENYVIEGEVWTRRLEKIIMEIEERDKKINGKMK